MIHVRMFKRKPTIVEFWIAKMPFAIAMELRTFSTRDAKSIVVTYGR